MTKSKLLTTTLTLSLLAVLVPMTAFGDDVTCNPYCAHDLTVTVYSDMNDNGIKDGTELPLAGTPGEIYWLITIPDVGVIAQSETNDGIQTLTGFMGPENYGVKILTIPEGYETSQNCPIETAFTMPTNDLNIEICLVPSVNLDTAPPVITLNGESEITLLLGESYTDAGAIVTDDDPMYGEIVTSGGDTVDTATPGTYIITYDAPADAAGNAPVQVTRTVTVLTAELSIDKIAQGIDDAITDGNIGNEGEALLAKLNQIMNRLNSNNTNVNAVCNQLDSFIIQLELMISTGTTDEIDALTPILDAANSIQVSYC
ncbi:MAG: DUF5011 domain-containing protein [Nitrosopumilus sp.]|nr:DUF5011 domain-containing protein [Nitrosopumilus sp.]